MNGEALEQIHSIRNYAKILYGRARQLRKILRQGSIALSDEEQGRYASLRYEVGLLLCEARNLFSTARRLEKIKAV